MSDWVRQLYFVNLSWKMLLIISFERFCYVLYSSIARLWMFLCWIVKEWYFWSNSWNELMLSLYTIRSECSCKYWFFYSVLYHKTFKLVDSSQTGLQWRISLGLSFVLQSYNLTSLLKQIISYQLFYINLKCARQRIMFYLYVTLKAFVY